MKRGKYTSYTNHVLVPVFGSALFQFVHFHKVYKRLHGIGGGIRREEARPHFKSLTAVGCGKEHQLNACRENVL